MFFVSATYQHQKILHLVKSRGYGLDGLQKTHLTWIQPKISKNGCLDQRSGLDWPEQAYKQFLLQKIIGFVSIWGLFFFLVPPYKTVFDFSITT